MSINLDDIKKNYSQSSNMKLEMIAMHKSASLSPEVMEILKEELLKRNISLNTLKINAQQEGSLKDIPIERKFYINREKRFFLIITAILVSFLSISLFYGELLNNHHKIPRRLIALAFVFLGILMGYGAIRQLFDRMLIIEIGATNMLLSINNPGLNQLNNILFLIKLLSNSLQKINIPYNRIVSVKKSSNFFKGTSIKVSFKDEKDQVVECNTFFKWLDKETDLPALKYSLKMKKVKGVDI